VHAVVLLADAAQVDPAQKVHAIGLGWSITAVPSPAHAVVVLIYVPWTQTNQKHKVELRLLDEDDHQVSAQGPAGPQPLELEAELEVGRPAGIKAGTEIVAPLTLNVGPGLPLAPDRRYVWKLWIDGHNEPEWSASFFVRRGS